MQKKRKFSGLQIAAVYASVFLGAGFASGQELLRYFVGFGPMGVWGLVVAGLLFALVGWATLAICRRAGIKCYSEFMRHLLGNRLGAIMEWLVAAFLFCLFVAMLAGAGATARQAFNLPFTAGAVVVGVFVYIVLRFDLEGMVKINVILAPFMIIGGILVGLFIAFFAAAPTFGAPARGMVLGWFISALVYASYNLVTGVPVLAATTPLATGRRDPFIGGVVGGGAITVLGLCMALPLFLHYSRIVSFEIPMLMIVLHYSAAFSILYLGVLISALITTAACNGFAVVQWLSRHGNMAKPKAAALICIVGVLAAHVGFSNIVRYVYPLFGLLGLFKIIVILFHGYARMRGKKVEIA
ncbi:MAG: hypothetical protein FWC77_07335 [Defluviitaleaceae bacterium]|nr:hypothetical protein [Defluviitaleaceae bacterium]